jgi:hypothetical protein
MRCPQRIGKPMRLCHRIPRLERSMGDISFAFGEVLPSSSEKLDPPSR